MCMHTYVHTYTYMYTLYYIYINIILMISIYLSWDRKGCPPRILMKLTDYTRANKMTGMAISSH